MANARSVALIEADARRRAQISHAGAAVGLHVEPFENPAEIHNLAEDCTVLMHDEARVLAEILGWCDRSGRWLPVVAYSADPTSVRVAEAVFAGALDYLTWPFSADDLQLCLERVGRRGERVGRRRTDAFGASARLKALSVRELQVVDAMTEGMTNKEIAERLQISHRTVEIHRANAIGKLGVENSSEAIILAVTARARV